MHDLKKLLFLTRIAWWRQSLSVAVSFASCCFPAALALGCGNLALWVGSRQLYELLLLNEITSEQLIRTTTSGFFSLLAGFVLVSWALCSWLVKLTAVARFCLKTDSAHNEELFHSCLADVRRKKGYLLALWSVASVYLLVPALPLSVLTSLQMLAVTGTLNSSAIVPGYNLVAVSCAAIILTLIAAGYSLLVLVLSASRLAAAGETAWLAVKLFNRRLFSVMLTTALIVAVNAVLTAPLALAAGGSLEATFKQSIYSYAAWQLWFAFSSSILWPWAVMPFCHLVWQEVGN